MRTVGERGWSVLATCTRQSTRRHSTTLRRSEEAPRVVSRVARDRNLHEGKVRSAPPFLHERMRCLATLTYTGRVRRAHVRIRWVV